MRARLYFVYILASRSRRLYVGVTNNLMLRLWQHRAQRVEFTARYQIMSLAPLTRLVTYELRLLVRRS